MAGGDPESGIILDFARKDAKTVNAEFLTWLDANRSGPFFAFLNYFDAHDPYIAPRGDQTALEVSAKSHAQFEMLRDWQKLRKADLSAAELTLARTAYDECIAALDRDLGALFRSLEQRGVLENTLLIVTADHGEQFGEHGEFGHGMSVYQPEIHVPLLIHFPRQIPNGRVVADAVSLSDLAATVLDLAGLVGPSPFPGRSLSAFWRDPEPAAAGKPAPPFSELAAPIEPATAKPASPVKNESVQAVVVDRFVYMHHGDGTEELYDLQTDPSEQANLVNSAKPELLDRCRALLGSR